ncbi:MAG: pyruvate kinase [Betaproteobacteria bacterium]|nr:pyruvate kinase [Betaproteobacteria bacterium]
MGLKKSSRLPSGSSAEQRRRSPATKRQGTNADVATRTLAVRARRAVERLRADALALEQEFAGVLRHTAPELRTSARNLLHYLAVRQHDVRSLQADLATLGLSSLGRLEAHTMASLDAVLELLDRLCGGDLPNDRRNTAAPCSIGEGNASLARHTDAILGPARAGRQARIMVTMPSEAAQDPSYVRDLVLQGMDIMRINCAHDGPAAWAQMIRHLRSAEKTLHRRCLVSFDLAGPKLRTGPIQPGVSVAKWRPKKNRLGQMVAPARVRFSTLPTEGEPGETVVPVAGDMVSNARIGDQITLVDARGRDRVLAVIETTEAACLCEARETAYVIPRTRLVLKRNKRTIGHAIVGAMPALPEPIQLRAGDVLDIVRGEVLGRPAVLDELGRTTDPAVVGCSLPEVFRCVRPGHRVFLDDGRISGVIRRVEPDRLRVRVTHAIGGVAKLRDEKGINLPDTDLKLPALTAKDKEDLAFVARHADMVAMSFVQRPEDIRELLSQLRKHKVPDLCIVLKIETLQAFSRLPALLLSAMRRPGVAVMVARGDLGVEVGFERLAEVQEEILWLCEAAHMPVVWATQVLESLAKGGMPSRAEVTDAAMGSRAECVMLNKGPYIVKTLRFLCDVLNRMGAHQSKKTSLLRKLKISDMHPATLGAHRTD